MKKLIAMFLSVMICLNIFSGMAFAAPVADHDHADETVSEMPEFNGTEDLIKQTIQSLIAEGKVITELEKPSAKLVNSVESCSGMSFDAVKTAVADALKENRESGKIDMSRYNLDKSDAAELMTWVLKDYFLVEAVSDVRYVTNAAGVTVEIRYTMSDGMSAALDEMQNEKENIEDSYDVGAAEDVVDDEVVIEYTEKVDYLAALEAIAEDGDDVIVEDSTDVAVPEESTDSAETPEVPEEPEVPAPTCMFHSVSYVEVDGQYYAAVQATWEMTQEIVAVDMTKENPELIFDSTTGEVNVVMADATTPGKINLVFTCTGAVFQCAKCGEYVQYTNNDMITNAGEQVIYYMMTGELAGQTVAVPAGTPADQLPDVIKNGTENVDWVNYTNFAIAVFPDDNTVFDAEYNPDPNTLVTLMDDVGAKRVEYYYSQMSLFNSLNADLFGISAPYWTSKNTQDNPMAAVKVLCNLDADSDVPANNMLLMVQMLPQAFMSYVYNYETQLLAMKDLAMAELKKLPSNATDVQKMLVLHDWLAEHATFDMGSMNDVTGSGGNNDPIQMTTFGAVLSEQLDNYHGGICLAYAAAYTWLVQWAFPEYYQSNGKFLAADKAQHMIDFVQIKFFADTSETSVAGAGFGGGYFNNVHYFNAVKAPAQTTANAKDWFYVDVCYDDISVECISQYRVEADGNLSHMNFLTSPKTIESLYKSSTDYIDSLYDGYTYVLTDEPYTNDDGEIVYNSDGTVHYKYEMVENPSETAYDNACYEDTWFSGAISPIHFDGKNWYYVDSGNTYVAYKDYMDENGDFNIGDMGNMGGDYDMGEVMHDNRVDPANADKLKVRAMSAPDYYPNTNSNNNNNMMGQQEAKADPYAEVLIKYGFGHVATNIPALLSKANDQKTDAVFENQSEGDSNNNYAGMTGMILEECKKDFAMNELYPGLVHTIALDNNIIYFNLANAIYTLDLSTGKVDQLKEYNDVYAASDANHNFKGASFYSVAEDSEDVVFHVKNRPIASFAIRDDITFTPIYINYGGNQVISGYNTKVTPTLICAIATNYAHSYPTIEGTDEFASYTKEATNYNPDYQRGVSDDDSNDNAEFLWCANVREKMVLKEMLEDYALLKNAAGVADGTDVISVEVGNWCEEGAFTDVRTAKFGLSDGSSKEFNGDSIGHHFETNEDGVDVCRHCLALAEEGANVEKGATLTTEFTWETDEETGETSCTAVTTSCEFPGCSSENANREFTDDEITTTVGENTISATVTLADGSKLTEYRVLNPGDVDGDDKINVLDVALLTQYLKNNDSSKLIEALSDLNADGVIDEKDINMLRSILAAVSSTTASGTNSASLSLSATPTTVRIDSEGKATVDVELSMAITGNNWNRRGVSIMDLSLSYDSSVMSIVSVTEGSLMNITNNTAKALLFEASDLTQSVTSGGVLATLTFEINGAIEEETSFEISVKADSAATYRNNAFESIAVTGGSTTINVLPTCTHAETELVGATDVTCTTAGYTGDVKCTVCDAIVTAGEEIPALGHDLNIVGATAATCTTPGYSGDKTCNRCDYVEVGSVIDSTGHTEETIPAVAATCTKTGLTEGTKCSVCNTVLVEQQVVEKLAHNVVVVSGTQPTCTTAGTTDGSYCSLCGEVFDEQKSIEALGHDLVTDAAVAATCTKTGLTEGRHCTRCSAMTVAQTIIPAQGHDMITDAAVAATCTQTGLTEGKHCSRCNDATVSQQTVPALGHDIKIDETVAATCTTEGYSSGGSCTRCNEAKIEPTVLPALGHDIVVDEAVAATCTQTGLTEGQHCSRCSDMTVAQTVTEALGHEIVEDAAVEATCTTTGLEAGSHCIRCNDMTVAQKITPALGHDIITETGYAATCTEAGLSDGRYCTRCDAETVEQTEIPALGHDMIVDIAVAATCTQEGLSSGSHCSRCDKTEEQKVIPALGHDIVTDAAVAATCTTTGLTEGKHCTRCDAETIAQNVTPALNHEIVIDNAVEATCTQTGLTEGKHCTRCDDETIAQEVIPALYHNIVVIPGVDATCTEAGMSEGRYCTRCDDMTVTQQEIAALGHDMIDDIAVAATCTQEGLSSGSHCSRCDKTEEQKVIPALGHDIVTDAAVAATCTTTGLTEGQHCSRCDGATVKQLEVAALGHNMIIDVAVAATCTTTGLTEGAHCTRCDDATIAQQEVAALEHNIIVVAGTPATCTTTGLTDGRYCTRCNDMNVAQTVISSLGHDIVKDAAVAATCTTTGLTEGAHCTRCDSATVSQKIVEALGHNVVIDKAVEATCTQTGLTEGKHCTRCDDMTVTQIEIAALGHDIIIDEAVAATCTTAGFTAGQHCSRCDAETIAQNEVAALGHNIIIDKAVAATCTTIGLTEGSHCSRCDDMTVKQEEIAMLGHISVELEPVAATCTTTGLTAGTYCSRCEEAIVAQEVVAAFGHNIIVVAGVAATCSAAGLTDGKYCSRCDAETVEQKEIAALGHDMIIDEAVAATCTATGLTAGTHCSRCDEVTVKQNVIDALGHNFSEWTQVKAPTINETGLEMRTCATCGEKQSRDIDKLDYLVGDANGDGQITAADARLILRVSAKIDKIESLNVPFAVLDLNKDGQITAADARLALRISAKLEG